MWSFTCFIDKLALVLHLCTGQKVCQNACSWRQTSLFLLLFHTLAYNKTHWLGDHTQTGSCTISLLSPFRKMLIYSEVSCMHTSADCMWQRPIGKLTLHRRNKHLSWMIVCLFVFISYNKYVIVCFVNDIIPVNRFWLCKCFAENKRGGRLPAARGWLDVLERVRE